MKSCLYTLNVSQKNYDYKLRLIGEFKGRIVNKCNNITHQMLESTKKWALNKYKGLKHRFFYFDCKKEVRNMKNNTVYMSENPTMVDFRGGGAV